MSWTPSSNMCILDMLNHSLPQAPTPNMSNLLAQVSLSFSSPDEPYQVLSPTMHTFDMSLQSLSYDIFFGKPCHLICSSAPGHPTWLGNPAHLTFLAILSPDTSIAIPVTWYIYCSPCRLTLLRNPCRPTCLGNPCRLTYLAIPVTWHFYCNLCHLTCDLSSGGSPDIPTVKTKSADSVFLHQQTIQSKTPTKLQIFNSEFSVNKTHFRKVKHLTPSLGHPYNM